MLVPGHLASAVLGVAGGARGSVLRPGWRDALLPAALGGLTPDLIDKTRMALGGSIYGRTVGHSLLFLVVILAAWAWVRRGRPVLGRMWGFWALGVASHLAADLADDAVRGWMGGGMTASSWFAWPWARPYDWTAYAGDPLWRDWPWPVTPLEGMVIALAVAWLVMTRRRTTPAPP